MNPVHSPAIHETPARATNSNPFFYVCVPEEPPKTAKQGSKVRRPLSRAGVPHGRVMILHPEGGCHITDAALCLHRRWPALCPAVPGGSPGTVCQARGMSVSARRARREDTSALPRHRGEHQRESVAYKLEFEQANTRMHRSPRLDTHLLPCPSVMTMPHRVCTGSG